MTVADVYRESDKLGCCWPEGWLAALETVDELLINCDMAEAKEILRSMIEAAQRPRPNA